MRTESIALVKRFLDLLEARDLDGARALVCGDFEMVFPGNARFTRFEELIAWAAPRYGWVRKRHERFDAAPAEDGIAVTCQGTLYGEDRDGRPFEGVRYMDWFLIVDGRIARQRVWNDLAAMRGGAEPLPSSRMPNREL